MRKNEKILWLSLLVALVVFLLVFGLLAKQDRTAAQEFATIPNPLVGHEDGALLSIGDTLYEIAGRTNKLGIHGFCEAYELDSDSWKQLSELPSPRSQFACMRIDRLIYVVGGMGPTPEQISRDVFAYDLESNVWERQRPLPQELIHITGTVYGGRGYMMGRTLEEEVGRTQVLEYSPTRKAWQKKSPAPVGIQSGILVSLPDSILVLGGTIHTEEDRFAPNIFVLRYRPESDSWDIAAQLPCQMQSIGVVNIDEELILIPEKIRRIGRRIWRNNADAYCLSTRAWTWTVFHVGPVNAFPQYESRMVPILDDRLFFVDDHRLEHSRFVALEGLNVLAKDALPVRLPAKLDFVDGTAGHQ